MKSDKDSILEKYDSYEDVPAAVKAWITMRARKESKDPVMAHAGYKAAFSRIQNQTTVTIIKEDVGYVKGYGNATPIHHIIKAKSSKMLKEKLSALYDEVVDNLDKNSAAYEDAVNLRDSNISVMKEMGDTIDIDGTILEIVSDPNFVSIR